MSGFAAGPAVSALLVPTFGIPAPFLVIAGATLLCIPVVVRIRVAEAPIGRPANEARFAFDLMRSRPMVAGLCMGAATFLMIGTFDALWAVVLDDLEASEWVANLGITIFAMPLIFLGSYGGRLAQRVGPFRLGPLGLILGACYLFLYGLMPTGFAMLAVGVIHAMTDGLTMSSTGVAVGLVAPARRQAGAQGMLGAAETLTAGVTAVVAGVLYSTAGRLVAYSVSSIVMIVLAVAAIGLAGPEYRSRRPPPGPVVADPATAVTGHA